MTSSSKNNTKIGVNYEHFLIHKNLSNRQNFLKKKFKLIDILPQQLFLYNIFEHIISEHH